VPITGKTEPAYDEQTLGPTQHSMHIINNNNNIIITRVQPVYLMNAD